jgi:hypothetical protein
MMDGYQFVANLPRLPRRSPASVTTDRVKAELKRPSHIALFYSCKHYRAGTSS